MMQRSSAVCKREFEIEVAPYDFENDLQAVLTVDDIRINNVDEAYTVAKYKRANSLVSSIFNKYHNGSHRAVDPFVIGILKHEEDVLFSIQCHIEQVFYTFH